MLPTIISFYSGDEYYYRAAENLRGDCEKLNLPYHIEELKTSEHEDWADICRKKVVFYHKLLRDIKGPVLWVDVDNRINWIPDILVDARYDFAAFLRGFGDLAEFNPVKFSRFWHPGILFFNNTDGGLSITDAIWEANKQNKGRVTDDYLLEEGWRKVGKLITALPLNRHLASINSDNPAAAFEFGSSGNVSSFKSKVEQHQNFKLGNVRAEILSSMAQKIVDKKTRAKIVREAMNRPIDDLDALLSLAKVAMSADKQLASSILVKTAALFPRKYESQRMLYELFFGEGRLESAKEVLNELLDNEYENWRNLAKSLHADLEAAEFCRKHKLKLAERVPLWWAKGPYPGNLGDILNPYLVQKITGAPPRFVERGKGMLAIGSVIKYAAKGTVVWGTGCSREDEKLSSYPTCRAVRGPITRDLLLRSGCYCPKIYGDPALLLPRFFNPVVRKAHKVGFIPHYQHRDEELPTDTKFVDLLRVGDNEIESFIREVKSCDAIVSTSLHGIIIANAYGIPARYATFSKSPNLVHGDGMKFRDYFLSVGMPVQDPLDLSELDSLDSRWVLKNMDRTVDLKIDLDRLLDSFPYPNLILTDHISGE